MERDHQHHRRRRDDHHKLALSWPVKRQKLMNHMTTTSTLFHWLLHKFIRRPSSLPAPPPPPASSYSFSDVQSKYDIFISFRGIDVRDTFLSHLYSYLKDHKKLTVYKDDVDLERGEQISPSLLRAIERSTAYIVVFSPNYADSEWCLKELVKILDCRERYGRRVIPVFYGGVDPSHVRDQTGRYGVPFTRRFQKLPAEMGAEVRSWRAALREAAEFAGFDSQIIRVETELIEEISKAVFQAIRDNQNMSLSVSYSNRGLIGVERRMQEVESLLCWEIRDNRTIGLWGMGGIGKTTLAKAIFDQFSSQFEASYFLSDFYDQLSRSSPRSYGDLQNDFFSKLLGDNVVIHDNMRLIRLSRMRALVVIDDVGDDVANIRHLKDFLDGRYCHLFGPGSRIVMTSRNKQLLENVCNHIFIVKPLDYKESFRLFCLHAFKDQHWSPTAVYEKMAWRAVRYSGGNPLALTVLGSHLYGRNDLKFWNRELNALQKSPTPAVESVLRRSYNGLSRVEKEVFLDIACFYSYWQIVRLEQMEKMMVGCRSGNPIVNLSDKSLTKISVSKCNVARITMDISLRHLGRNIVNEESRPGKRSRLWKAKDIYSLLKNNKGTESIEGIFWECYDNHFTMKMRVQGKGSVSKGNLEPDAFMKMENLQFLVIRDKERILAPPAEGLKYLPNTLRILEWYSFPSKCLASNFSPENLVSLTLISSNIEQLWEGSDHVDLGSLKFLTLTASKYLRKLPDLSTAKRLEEIRLADCLRLVELPTSMLDLPKLELLDVRRCRSLKWNNLETSAEAKWSITHHSPILPNLKIVLLSETPIQKVPRFITRLHISELQCYGCKEMTEFPVIPSLKSLSLTRSSINEVGELKQYQELTEFNFPSNQQLIHLPNDFCELKSLARISLAGSTQLNQFPDVLDTMDALWQLDLSRCSSLSRLPDSISNLTHLGSLYLSCSAVRELPSSIGDLKRLSSLLLDCCKSLVSLPSTIHKLSKLETLVLSGCDQLSHLPLLPSSLIQLDAYGCKSLQTLSMGCGEKDKFPALTWNMGRCGKLDPQLCSKLAYEFARDSVRSQQYSSSLLLPAKLGGSSRGEEGRNGSVVRAKLRGDPWMVKGIIYYAVISSLPTTLITHSNNSAEVECVLLNNGTGGGGETVVSSCRWKWLSLEFGHDSSEPLHDLVMWHGNCSDWKRKIQYDDDDDDEGSITAKLLFRIRINGDHQREMQDLIETCGVVPVYSDRVVTCKEEEDDDDQSAESLRGLYERLCTSRGS